ncbi:MAG: bifunctional phosphoglucose/phosphomannose isomerase [Candidatus Saganbacteria bacterium]|nr:bifunctional phosphoglucose/phosphomannose isomerase [Candidatus Saganbacteria bacterium]
MPNFNTKLDKNNMLGTISNFGQMVKEGLGFQLQGKINKGIKNVVVVGMGGSAISGELLLGLYKKELKLPVVLVKGYGLPGFVGINTLVVLISYSGNTEETLSALKEAEGKNAAIATITAGGKLRELGEKKGYPTIIVPGGQQPRAALPYLFFALHKVFEEAGLVTFSPKAAEETLGVIKKLEDSCNAGVPTRANQAKQLAMKLEGKTPLVYGSEGLTGAVAYRWKCQFNENSKILAFSNLFPEMNHNELVGLNELRREDCVFSMIILREEKDNERIKKRIEIAKSFLAAKLGGIIEIEAEGATPLAKMFSLILLGDYISTYLALLLGSDPTEIEILNRLKKEMTR